MGSQSYTYAVPIVHLPGRAGLDVNLTAYYNSAIWTYNPANASVTFDADHDWPSYGFRLDFGLLESVGTRYYLIEHDGTKHSFAPLSNGSTNTTDSTYINLVIGTPYSTVTYKNGRQVLYELFPSTQSGQSISFLRPRQINDTDGNYISITYAAGTDQQINTITDTVGRVVQFNYDGNGNLSSITSNNGTRTWATFTWNTAYSLAYNFSATVDDSPASGSTLSVLTGINFPNGSGYAFTYGAWGMINQITDVSSTGKTRSYQSYNYPGTGTALSMPPTYTQQTVFDGASARNWSYASSMSNNMLSQNTVTDPSGTATITNFYTSSGDWRDGLVSSVQVKDSSGKLLRESDNTWTADATSHANPRLSSILNTLSDSGQQSRVDFLGYDSYGNPTDQKEYDFGLTPFRETVNTYSTATTYVGSHILDLLTETVIKDGSGNTISKLDYAYDTATPTTITGAANHNDNYSGPRADLTSVTEYADPVGGTGAITRTFAYDSLGNLITAQLDCCNQEQWNYSSGTQYTYPDSVVRGPAGTQLTTSTTYNLDTGTVATSTDENLQVTNFQYDSTNRVVTVTRPDTVAVTYSYDDAGVSPAVSVSNSANSAVQRTVLDGLGRALQQQLLNGSTLVSSRDTKYDDINHKIQNSNPYTTGETQLWTTSQFDALGRVTQVTPPSGGSYQHQYSGNATLVTDPAGKQRRSFNDYASRLIQVDEPPPGTNAAGTSGSGSITVSGAEHSSTTSGTKSTGSFTITGGEQSKTLTQTCYPDPNTGLNTCDPPQTIYDSGQVTVTVNGFSSNYTYGQNDDVNSVAAGLAAGFNVAGSPVTASASGATVYLTANQAGPNYSMSQLSLTSDPSDFSYPSFGVNLSGSSTTGGVYPVTTYDSGTMTVTIGSFQASASYNQSLNTTASAMANALAGSLNAAASPVTASISPSSATTILLTAKTYGASTNYSVTGSSSASFTVSSTTLSGGVDPLSTYYSYDAVDNLLKVTQGAQTRIYNRDGLGRLTSSVLPEDGTTSFTYTDFGAVSTRRDARGVVTNYAYDGLNRLSSITYNVGSTGVPATPSVTYAYGTSANSNNNGRPLTMTDALGSETYSYDPVGHITRVSRVINGTTYNIAYAYAAGELSSITYPSGRVVSPGHDAIGRGIQVASGGTNYLSGVTFNSAQLPTGFTYGNGVQASFSYNDHLQLASLAYSSSSNTLLSLSYNYGGSNNGQIQGITDSRGSAYSTSYTYDELGRLSQAKTSDLTSANTWNLAWSYDRYGNRLSQTLTGGTISIGQPQLTVDPTTNRIASSGFTYDASGNLTADVHGTYTFDAENHISQSATNSVATSYSYDGKNRRVGKGTTVYIFSGSKVIAEYSNGSLSKEYLYWSNNLLATVSGSSVTYHHPDQLSDRLETDSSANVMRTFGHLPFGESWYETGTADKWKFTGYERDSGESGMDYATNRYYSSGYGRFASRDILSGSVLNPQSLNRYSYVLNDTTNLIDPLGLDAQGNAPDVPYICINDVCTAEGSIGGTTIDVFGDPGQVEADGGGGTEDPVLPMIKMGGHGPAGTAARFFLCLQGLNNLPGRHTMRDAMAALNRADSAQPTMQAAAGNNWPVLAAIGMRETYFRNIDQYGDGLGRGIFQIDIGQNPSVSADDARDINFAADWAWNKLSSDMNKYTASPANLNSSDILQEAIHDYNGSPTRHGGTMNLNLAGVTGLDRFTTGHNYVANVSDVINCFQLGGAMTGLPKFTF